MEYWATILLQCFPGNLKTHFRAVILKSTHKQMKQSIQEWTEYLWNKAFKKFEVMPCVLTDSITANFFTAVFHKVYLVHS